MNVCWDCVKGRHSICKGSDEEGPCACPVCAVEPNTQCERKPEYVDGEYIDPGAEACANGEADVNVGDCLMHPRSWEL